MSEVDSSISITFRNDIAELDRLSEVVTQFGALAGLPDDASFALDLALHELFINIVTHGEGDPRASEIRVRLRLSAPEVVAEIDDDGTPFNPLTVPAADTTLPLEERDIGGLGIHLVRNLTDALEYRHEDGRNVLTLRKTVPS